MSKSKEKDILSGAGGSSSASMTVENLRQYLAEKLNFSDSGVKAQSKILSEFSIDGIVDFIQKKGCKNIVTLAGAGISTSAGIPDFRTPGSGLYDNLQKYNLPHPQAIFELDFFENNPTPFFTLAKELYPGSFKPTVCHYFLRMLEMKGMLLRHYTQNIDTLERVAGISDEKLIEAHGSFYTGHCMLCKKEYELSWMKDIIFADEIPICTECPGIVKPDIVFFGENLPLKFYECVDKDFAKCDLLIVMGSSLVVQPIGSLVDRVSDEVPRLLINREKAGQVTGLMAMLGISGGFDFDSSYNTRDVAWLGDCDEGCQLLADKLGWGDELRELVVAEHKKIDTKESNVGKVEPKSTEKSSTSQESSKAKGSNKAKISIKKNGLSKEGQTSDKSQ